MRISTMNQSFACETHPQNRSGMIERRTDYKALNQGHRLYDAVVDPVPTTTFLEKVDLDRRPKDSLLPCTRVRGRRKMICKIPFE